MRKLLLLLAALSIALAAILVLRTTRFTSKQIKVAAAEDIMVDSRSLAGRLARAIEYKTISQEDGRPVSAEEFLRFHQFLQSAFPRVHAMLTREVIGGYSLLYTWKGTDPSRRPILLMAHMDVVPADAKTAAQWTHPPFSGRNAAGYIWGRGTMDDKASVLGILEAVEYLLAEGFQPQTTVYLAFGHDEETGGNNGAAKIAGLLRSRHIELEYILDEGGNIAEGIIPGITAPVALVGIAEKGYLNLEMLVESSGGHSSMPPDHTVIGIVSDAIHKLERSPFPTRLTEPTQRFFEFIGPEMPWTNRMVMANLWLFNPLLRRQLARSPLTAAMIRTTQAATIFEAGVKENVLPVRARAVVNFRILPGESVNSVIEHVRSVLDDTHVRIAPLPPSVEPSSISTTHSSSYQRLELSIRQIIPGAIVAPSLLVAATDSRHYAGLTKNIYRFLPITLRSEDTRRYHGIDERISMQDYERSVRFYIRLIKNSQS